MNFMNHNLIEANQFSKYNLFSGFIFDFTKIKIKKFSMSEGEERVIKVQKRTKDVNFDQNWNRTLW